jgi:hypothetical protein
MGNELNPRTILRELQRRELRWFVRQVFETLHPGQTYVPAWHVDAMCRLLQDVAEGLTRRALIMVPPRHLKSICASVALPAWMLGRNPALKIMVASYGSDLAALHGSQFRTIMEAPWYRELFPRARISPRRSTDLELRTTAGGGRKAVSLGGAVTGFGADVLIIDDLMKAADAQSLTERQRVKDFYEQTLFSRLNDKRNGPIVAIQQRLHEDDLAAYLMDQPHRHHVALHRAGQAGAERLRRELQRPLPRRVPERGGVHQPCRGPRRDRALAARLQPGAATLGPRRP